MNEDAEYQNFVENYFDTGVSEVPAGCSSELRERCLFFLRMSADESPDGVSHELGVRSVVDLFAAGGSCPDMTLAIPDHQPPPVPAETGERYVVEKEIARGGMGRILLAYDRDFRRRIAMKMILRSTADSIPTSRFLEEAQATAQLEHPNIAPVYDLDVDANNSPFFTMKWIRGQDLKEIIETGGDDYSLTRLLQILQQVAMAVHFANSRGVVHRDLKPQNIMVGDFGEVLVVDWGLAKVTGVKKTVTLEGARPDAEEISTKRADEGFATLDGTIQGSPSYLAPEHARGEISAIDARTDVFGLGTILYEILTGCVLYEDSSVGEVLLRARQCEIEPPRKRAPERNIPARLEEICVRALAADKEARFQSAEELHNALQNYIEGKIDAKRRAAEALRLREIADELGDRLKDAEVRAAARKRQEEEVRAAVRDSDPEEKKKPLWDLAEKSHGLKEEVQSAFNRTTSAYLAVLSIQPDDPQARPALAGLYYDRLVDAEDRNDAEAATLYENLVAQYHAGHFDVELQGGGGCGPRAIPPEPAYASAVSRSVGCCSSRPTGKTSARLRS